IIATWQESEDPDTPTSSLVYLLSVNSGSSTIATSGIRITATYATAYTVSVTARDPEGNTSTPATVATTTPAAPPPPVEETLFEVTDAITDSGFWGRGTDTAIDEIAERYVPATAQRICAAFHRIATFSGPTDSVLLRLSTDSIGGTLLSSSTVSASIIPSSPDTPTEFRFPACVSLVAGTTYWFHWTRTALTSVNGYISRFRPGDQFSNSSYWQLHKYTMDPFGWAEFVSREWSLKLVGFLGL
ncbi:MAG: hypothetical protein Q7S84_04395, partial [bacterium]|nr:hypothetical protein [bacterium]